MDNQNAEIYKLNKKCEDIIYPHFNETIIYRKIVESDNTEKIIEIRKINGQKGQTVRIVPSNEMSVEKFDYWKQVLKETNQEHRNEDVRNTRKNVNIENLLETDIVCTESLEEEYLRREDEALNPTFETWENAMLILASLTEIQRRRFILRYKYKKSVREISEIENVGTNKIDKSLEQAKKKIKKILQNIKK